MTKARAIHCQFAVPKKIKLGVNGTGKVLGVTQPHTDDKRADLPQQKKQSPIYPDTCSITRKPD
jgi:hypothetical protein